MQEPVQELEIKLKNSTHAISKACTLSFTPTPLDLAAARA